MEQDGRRPFELVYHGQFDDSRPSNNIPITGRFVIYVTAFNIFQRSCYVVKPKHVILA